MVESFVIRSRKFDRSHMVPSHAGLRAAGKRGSLVANAETRRRLFRNGRPPLIGQRSAAWRQPWRPHGVNRFGAALVCQARGGYSQKLVIENVEEVARGKAIRRIQNVRLSPSDELLSRFERQAAFVVDATQPPDFTKRRPVVR